MKIAAVWVLQKPDCLFGAAGDNHTEYVINFNYPPGCRAVPFRRLLGVVERHKKSLTGIGTQLMCFVVFNLIEHVRSAEATPASDLDNRYPDVASSV